MTFVKAGVMDRPGNLCDDELTFKGSIWSICCFPKIYMTHYREQKNCQYLESRISLVERKKKVDSEDGESTSNKSSGSDEKQLCRARRLWEVLLQLLITLFPGHPHLLHSICTFSQLFCRVEIEGDPNVGWR